MIRDEILCVCDGHLSGSKMTGLFAKKLVSNSTSTTAAAAAATAIQGIIIWSLNNRQRDVSN